MSRRGSCRSRLLRCPKCGYSFDISYGRAFACRGCPSVIQCHRARCPNCYHEFEI